MERVRLGNVWQAIRRLLGSTALVSALTAPALSQELLRVSESVGGGSLDADVLFTRLNVDGTVVLLLTQASNLVEGDRNGKSDVFVVDLAGGVKERVSLSFLGRDPNDGSFPGVLSDDGTIVVFGSAANNLVTGDFNRTPDLFLYDRTLRRTTVLTLANEGLGGGTVPDLPPAVSPDGRWIAFASQADDLVENDRNEASDVFVLDRLGGSIEAVTLTRLGATEIRTANGPSAGPAISSDGCVVAFFSDATNLVERDRNQARDVFVRDRCSGAIERASVASDGSEANGPSQAELATLALSGDGRFVAFACRATNLDGDTGRQSQIFLRDRAERTTRLVSRNQDGDIANAPSVAPSLDRQGRFLVFQSSATNLTNEDLWPGEDVFVVDLTDGEVRLLSRPSAGGVADGDSYAPSISADGSRVSFLSAARLSPSDTDRRVDAYLVSNPMFGKPPGGVTPTPTETVQEDTPTAELTPTLTATRSPTATHSNSPTPTSTHTPTSTPSPEASPSPTPTGTATVFMPAPSPTRTAVTPSPSPTRRAGDGGNGCSCRVNPQSGRLLGDPPSGWALAPLALWWWRRRLARR